VTPELVARSLHVRVSGRRAAEADRL